MRMSAWFRHVDLLGWHWAESVPVALSLHVVKRSFKLPGVSFRESPLPGSMPTSRPPQSGRLRQQYGAERCARSQQAPRTTRNATEEENQSKARRHSVN